MPLVQSERRGQPRQRACDKDMDTDTLAVVELEAAELVVVVVVVKVCQVDKNLD